MKDEQVLSLETELEILRQNENSQNYEMSQQSKNLKRQIEKMQVTEKKLQDESVRLNGMLNDTRQKLKAQLDENDQLQDKVHELKALAAERGTVGHGDRNTFNQSLSEFERQKMQEAIDELNQKLKKQTKNIERLEKENNFYCKSTTIFFTIKRVLEGEKMLCWELAQLMGKSPQDKGEQMLLLQEKQAIESKISKCRENHATLEKKLVVLQNGIKMDK